MLMDTSRLKHFGNNYFIVGVCGISDPAKDTYTDEEITISKPFTITGAGMSIEALMNAQMTKALVSPIQPVSPNGSQQVAVNPNVSIWYKAALVRKDTNFTRIKSLADIKHDGGRVVDPAMWQ